MPQGVTGRSSRVGRGQLAGGRRRRNLSYSVPVHLLMAAETTYARARANLKALLDEAADTREPVIIRRRGGDDVALIAVDELQGLIEAAHLRRSPKNAERLLRALARAKAGKLRPCRR